MKKLITIVSMLTLSSCFSTTVGPDSENVDFPHKPRIYAHFKSVCADNNCDDYTTYIVYYKEFGVREVIFYETDNSICRYQDYSGKLTTSCKKDFIQTINYEVLKNVFN